MKIIKEFQGGGSSAGTLLVEDNSGKKVVLKFANWSGIGSNGIPWLKAQFTRLKELKASLSPLGASRIPEVYDYAESNDGVYYTLQYYPKGIPLSIYHFERPEAGTEDFFKDFIELLSFMSKEFYSKGKLETPDGYLEHVHISRLNYRLGLLYKKEGDVYERLIKNRSFKLNNGATYKLEELFNEIWNLDIISINNQDYLNASTLLHKLKNDAVILDHLTPSFLPKFAHGDALLRNFMKIPNKPLIVFDVRGVELPDNSPARIDISYELGKYLHGILLEIIRNDAFTLEITKQNGFLSFQLNYDLHDKRVLNFLAIRKEMPTLMKNHAALNQIMQEESDWFQKSLFCEATHFLTDAVNRLENDLSSSHAIAYYLIGTLLLNDYFNEHESIHSGINKSRSQDYCLS